MNAKKSMQTNEEIKSDSIISEMDASLKEMSPVEKAEYLRKNIIDFPVNLTPSQSYLFLFWKFYSESLWSSISTSRPHDFREWIDKEITPTFKKRHDTSKKTRSMIADIVRIVERTLPYAMKNPARDYNDELITPQYLIEKVGFSKLKITSSQFLDNGYTPLRETILRDLTIKSASEIRKLYSSSYTSPIHYAQNFHPDTGYDIIILGLNENQQKKLETWLQKTAISHPIKLSTSVREALLKELPFEAREQEVQDLEED